MLFAILPLSAFGQEHFDVVWEGNPYSPMNIYVYEASVNGEPLQAGDEIGIFDGDL